MTTMREKAIEAAAEAIQARTGYSGDIAVAQATAAYDAIIAALMEPDEAMIAASRDYDDGRDCGAVILQAMLKATTAQ